jgi:5-methylcytosine-specific restriction endonuclease McrA
MKADLVGRQFKHLLVVRDSGRSEGGRVLWECLCDCGNTKIVNSNRLQTGNTSSCGCQKGARKKDPLIRRIWGNYKDRAKHRGYAFDLSLDKFKDLILDKCFYCGIENSNISERSYFGEVVSIKYNGVDRVDNSKGYHDDNVVTCCKVCNQAKHTMSFLDYILFIDRAYNYIKRGSDEKENN